VRLKTIALVFLFSIFCILVGIFLVLGGFSDNPAGVFGRSSTQDHLLAQASRMLAVIKSMTPDGSGSFFYTLDTKLLFFAVVAVLGVLMTGLAIKRATVMSRNDREKPASQLVEHKTKKIRRGTPALARVGLWIRSRTRGLTWKMAGPIAGLTMLIGALVIGTVYYFIVGALRNQANQRASAVATNLSDGAAALVLRKDLVALHALLAKYALLEGVAYVFVEDLNGSILARSWGSSSREPQVFAARGDLREERRTEGVFSGEPVDEIRVPILDGQIGAVHVGIWRGAVERDVGRVFYPIVTWISGVLVVGVLLVVIVAWRIQRPIRQLARNADSMSKGDLDTSVEVTSSDEIGELAIALERMRASLKAAFTRLNQ
jgi:HAMP domain-containing protein